MPIDEHTRRDKILPFARRKQTRRTYVRMTRGEVVYYVYIMASNSHRLYIGVTNNLERRALEHKTGHFAKKYRITNLVYYDTFHEITDAIAAEKRLKGWRREKKIRLIEQNNPYWEDLAGQFEPE